MDAAKFYGLFCCWSQWELFQTEWMMKKENYLNILSENLKSLAKQLELEYWLIDQLILMM